MTWLILFAEQEGILDGALKGGLRGAVIGGAVGALIGLIMWIGRLGKGKKDQKKEPESTPDRADQPGSDQASQ